MERINIKCLTNRDKSFIEDGTAARFLALNPYNNKYGVLKLNGCMVGLQHEDLREKLASKILNICGVPCAEVDLCVDDDNKHYCLSYNVLEQNQVHVKLAYSGELVDSDDKELVFNEHFKKIFASVVVLPGITNMQYHAIRKRILEIYFMNIIVGNYDAKSDNMKIIYDNFSRMYLPPIAYDYGVAFSENGRQKNGIFKNLTASELMFFLIKYYYSELEELIGRIQRELTYEKIIEILDVEDYKPLGKLQVLSQIKFKLIVMNRILSGMQKKEFYNKSSKSM